MCFALAKILTFSSLIDNGRFENFQRAFTFGNQLWPNAEGKSEHRALRVSNGSAVNERNLQKPQDFFADFANRWTAGSGGLAIREIAEENARNLLELPRLAQMTKRAIHLVRLHSAIFEDQDGAVRIRLEAGAERGLQHGQAAADDSPGCVSSAHVFALQRNLPTGFRFAHGLQEGNLVVTGGLTGA